MAKLLMRTPELADAEKLAVANVERAWQLNEKALSHGEQGGPLRKASAEVRSRARKGKSGQKKLPQRGLGVAQLEKLRLQEQSKLEAARLASLQSLPSMGFTDQNQNGAAMYLRHIKGAISHHHSNHHSNGHGTALGFGNGRLEPPDKVAGYLARESHTHVGKGGDVFRTFMSLASTDHSRLVSLSRHERGHSVSIMLPNRKGDGEMSFICNNSPQVVTLENNVHASHASPSSVNNPGTDGTSPARPACVASSSNTSVISESAFFSGTLVSGGCPVNNHPSSAEMSDEKRSSAEVDTPNMHGFSSVSDDNKGGMEVGMINAKLRPVYVTAGAGGAPIFTLTNLQYFESPSGPADVGRHPRENNNQPVVGISANCDRSKELPSIQSFSSNHSFSDLNKPCGWKRPWQALHESTCKPLHSNRLDLNALVGETDAADKDCDSTGVAQGQQSAVEAHHSEGLIRNASEVCSPRPFKIRLCGTWDEARSSKAAAVRGVGFYTDESPLKDRTSESNRKDSCSCVFPPGSLTLNRRRCLSSPEKSTGDFLTLGLSSYSASAQHEGEISSEETMICERTKQVNVCSKEGYDVLRLQMCIPQQAQQMGSYSPSVAKEFLSGEEATTHARLSYRCSSLSSGSLTEHCHRQTERKVELLDLRLKLAL